MMAALLDALARSAARAGSASIPLLAGACLVLGSCASAPPELPGPTGERLPFHLAIVPIGEAAQRLSEQPDEAVATAMRLDLDPDALSDRLAAELGQFAFTRVTLLDADSDPVALARAERADLILECDLQFEAPIWRRRTGSLALNYLAFALGGPFGAVMRDTEFLADAELTASLYEVGLIDENEVQLGDSQARVLLTEASFPALALSFNERREGTSSLWKSLFVPTAHLAQESPAIEAMVQDQVADHLTRGLARILIEKRQAVLERGRGSFFAFDPASLQWTRLEDGRVRVRGQAVLRPTGLVERMSGVRLLCGEQLVTQEFGEGAAHPDGTAYDIDLAFEPGSANYLRFELAAGSRDPVLKSYTFDLRRVLPPATAAP